ncbi:MAG: B12-binding domain-containing radical SAM protein [Thermoprotei archaeon]|nr:MAG: B12-binding domain-containing radical SAM protein [Thermoprotei archaeon]
MRVLLTLPPDIHHLEIYRVTGMKAPPLGLAYIASVLEEAGHKVGIIDTPTLEIDQKTWLSEVRSWNPDVVGVSIITPTAPRGYRAIRELKRLEPDIPIIVGGPHPTFMYEEALDSGADVVVLGEGEYTMRELVEVIERHGLNHKRLRDVRGVAFRDRDGRIVVTPPRPPIENLDKLPFPARHLLPMDRYTLFGKPIKVAHVMASRGCPYGCIYCITSYFWGRRIRFRSAKSVADEVEEIVDRYRARYIVFTDDELTVGRKFVYDFVNEMRSRGLDIVFACGSRVDHVTKDYMKFLYDNGCVALYFGVESASQETLDRIGKRITIEQVRRVFRWKKELGGFATASFILGFPWETLEDMKRTVEFAIELDPDYAQFTVLTPYPGTPFFEYAKKHGLVEDWNWEHYTTVRAVIRGFNFTRQQLQKMLTYAYRRFYLRAGFILKELRAGRLKDLAGTLLREVLAVIKEVLARPLRWGV